MPRSPGVPKYRRHKQSGQAVVTLRGGAGGRRDVLLGKFGTAESKAEYARVIREWETNSRRLPPRAEEAAASDLSVNELALAYWKHAEEYHKAQKTGCGIEDLQFSSRAALEPMIALLSVVAVTLLNLREASRQPDAKERRASELVDERYVAVLSAWRYQEVREGLSVQDFFCAVARLGGQQNRKGDHHPGWLVLWRGWMALQHMVAGAEAVKSRG